MREIQEKEIFAAGSRIASRVAPRSAETRDRPFAFQLAEALRAPFANCSRIPRAIFCTSPKRVRYS